MISRTSEVYRRGWLGWLPLRVRITLWVLAIFAVVHTTLSLVFVLFQRQAVQRQIRADLVDTAEAVASESMGDVPSLLMVEFVQHERSAKWGPLASVVFNDQGEIITSTGPYRRIELRHLADHAMGRAETTDDTVFETSFEAFLYTLTTLPDGRRLVVAAPVEQMHRAVDPVAAVLLLTLPIGLLSTGVATWYMSGLAVRPIQQMQSFAEELSAETVSDSIDLDHAGPEVEELREELQAAMRRLREGYDRQARFLANVSHELKTPISVVRTEAEVLLAGNASEADLREFAGSASEEMHRLGRMIESFLLLTRIRQGGARIKPKRHEANDVLMESVGSCLGMAEQHDVRISPMLYDGEDELLVEGNGELLETAISNLIRNAVRFAPKGTAVEVRCLPKGERVAFNVRDHGPGVPPELVDRIFEPFTQADEERRRGRGTGLGLQIAQGIAELHGGEIGVANLENGCRFTILLPRAKPNQQK